MLLNRGGYRPTRHRLDADGFVVVVEGVRDALALTAAAATSDQLGKLAPITASGLSVSHVQAIKVLTLSSNPVTLAFDGDEAGRTGAGRWTDMLCRQLGRDVVVLPMPEGLDPADWLAREGVRGLDLFLSDGIRRSHSRPVRLEIV